ncbi:MAG: hypothetical protein O3A01_05020 [bacterium]|nr:hypothetical protein [bacterium]
MKAISKDNVLKQLHHTHNNNQNVDQSILSTCLDSDYFYTIILEDLASIHALMLPFTTTFDWLFTAKERKKKHSAIEIAKTLIEKGHTFNSILESHTISAKDKQWFNACTTIYDQFDMARLSWPIIIPINNQERSKFPHATFRLYNGFHRLIVYAYKVLKNEIPEAPIECLLVGPRREGWARIKRDLLEKIVLK